MNQEFLVELEKTGNLANLATRITTTRGKLNQTAIQINNTNINITNTVINLANTLTAKDIQKEIDTIANVNVKNLDVLPNQISGIRGRLNENRKVLYDIEDIQTKINNITNPNTTPQIIQTNINTTQRQINACSSIGAILENISGLDLNPGLNETDNS